MREGYINLLDETLETLKEWEKTPEDVRWVQCGDRAGTWDDFALLAKNIDYHNGYGSAEIDLRLKIVGEGWWLERHEYDGREWWDMVLPPAYPTDPQKLTTLKEHRFGGVVS